MDISSLATHIKCNSDLSKIYPGVEISDKDRMAALNLIIGEDIITELQNIQEQIDLRVYDIFSNPVKHKTIWKELNITQEIATKEIEAYHKKFGTPDMSKLIE